MVYQYFIVLSDYWVSRIILLCLPACATLSDPQCQSQGFCMLCWATSHTRTSKRWKQQGKEKEVNSLEISSLPLPQILILQLFFFFTAIKAVKMREQDNSIYYCSSSLIILNFSNPYIWFKFSSKTNQTTRGYTNLWTKDTCGCGPGNIFAAWQPLSAFWKGVSRGNLQSTFSMASEANLTHRTFNIVKNKHIKLKYAVGRHKTADKRLFFMEDNQVHDVLQ